MIKNPAIQAEMVGGDHVRLVMPRDVAVTLQIIMMKIAGNPYRSRRGHADEIRRALRNVGIRMDEVFDGLDVKHMPKNESAQSGGIYFTHEDIYEEIPADPAVIGVLKAGAEDTALSGDPSQPEG